MIFFAKKKKKRPRRLRLETALFRILQKNPLYSLFLIFLIFLFILFPKNNEQEKKVQHNKKIFSGLVFVHDGDTLKIEGVSLRLRGLDAPELNQVCLRGDKKKYACGHVARKILYEMTKEKIVECKAYKIDRYGRPLADCWVQGKFINETLVKKGWAVSYGAFDFEENFAQKFRLGLWKGHFDIPHEWRKKQKKERKK